jgi:hypothetical protein
LELNSHILRLSVLPRNKRTRDDQWGALLPEGYVPASLDILAHPTNEFHSPLKSSAVDIKCSVLIADNSPIAIYHIFQLQLTTFAESNDVSFEVLTRRAAVGAAGSHSELFLASSSFAFDLLQTTQISDDSYVATIGVLNKDEFSLDVIAVSQDSTVVAANAVLAVAGKWCAVFGF